MSEPKKPAFDFFAPRRAKRPLPSTEMDTDSSDPPTKKPKLSEENVDVEPKANDQLEPSHSSIKASNPDTKTTIFGTKSPGIINDKIYTKPVEDGDDIDDDEVEEEKDMNNQFPEEEVDEELIIKEEEEVERAISAAARKSESKEVTELRKLISIWEAGKPVPYLALARAFREIQQNRSTLRHIEVIREFFRAVLEKTPNELVPCIYLATNKLAPQFEGIELGIGETILQKAIVEATGKSMKMIRAEYKKLGDLGLVAQASGKSVRTLVQPKPLTVMSVFQNLHAIASEKGNASQKKKQVRIRALLVACKEYESMYIIKALQGKLRINLGPKSVIAGLAHAFAYVECKGSAPSEEFLLKANKLLRAAFARRPDWEVVVSACLKHGLKSLPETCKLTIGVPVEPMLAQPTTGVDVILQRLEGHDTFTAEYKYDGERAQIHLLPDGTIKIYSRNLEDNTGRYPDILQRLHDCYIDPTSCKSFIIDCEAVAYDLEQDKILPYQVLSTRARKDVSLDSIKVQVCLYLFDILYLNGESLLELNLKERREKIAQTFKPIPGRIHLATHREFTDAEELEAFLTESIDNQCEGLMIKTWNKDAQYEPARRSPLWLKFKKDYKEGLSDSIDLVPIGAWYGKGKRTGVFGAYLLACYNEESEEYQSACKIGTGFSDAQLQELTQKMKEAIVSERSYYSTGDALKPDVWFDPITVWEIRAADLSLSPQHKAAFGLVSATRGIGLRFPRFLRIRTDKSPEQATNAEQIAYLYRNQKIHGASKSHADDGYD